MERRIQGVRERGWEGKEGWNKDNKRTGIGMEEKQREEEVEKK